MPRFSTIEDVDVRGKVVLVRADLNVPFHDGAVSDDTRLKIIEPTLRSLMKDGAKIVVLSHFGRPKGESVPHLSLKPVAEALSGLLGAPVVFVEDCIGQAVEQAIETLPKGGIAVLENLRFHPGEEANDTDFARKLAEHGDIYVNDAFSAAHRAHASVDAITRYMPSAAGYALAQEIDALTSALEEPERPLAALVGGAKVSTKLGVLDHLLDRVDSLIIGGAMANTFLAAQQFDVGSSLVEKNLVGEAGAVLQKADDAGKSVLLPVDVIAADALEEHIETRHKPVDKVSGPDMILDVGPETVARLNEHLNSCRTLVWNGPLGAFETPPFDKATIAVARHAATLTIDGGLRTVAGGGDTIAALNQAGVTNQFTHVSTAGGAFLEWLEGRELPGIKALELAARRN